MKRLRNSLMTFLYPCLAPGEPISASDPYVALAFDGEFLSICTDDGCAVFDDPAQLRALIDTLDVAADLFEKFRAERDAEKRKEVTG